MLSSWKEHMEQNMVKVQIKAIAGFIFDGKSIQPGETIECAKGFAREMVHANKAVILKPEAPAAAAAAPAPGPAVVAQDPANAARRQKP